MADDGRGHWQRVVSAAVLLPPILLLILRGSAFQFLLLLWVVLALALYELLALARAAGLRPPVRAGVLLGLGLSAGLVAGRASAALALTVGALLAGLVAGRDPKGAAERAGFTLLAVCYIGGLGTFAGLLRALPRGERWLLVALLVTWAGDTGAYYTGRRWGRRPLAPSLSPKKTLEGAVGGLIASLAGAVLAWVWFAGYLGGLEVVGLGLGLGVLGQVGDLAESLLKRSLGAKDSGRLIPGHGGILDVIDGLLFALPGLYLYVTLAGRL